MTTPQRRPIKPGEPLAIQPDHVHTSPQSMWWDMFNVTPQNERVGANSDIAVVHIQGALDHHRGYGGCSYESILENVTDAISGEDVCKTWQDAHRWSDAEDDDPEPTATPPKCIVLRIDSPGGVVSGLNETVFAIRKMAQSSGIAIYAYVDEMATSAAFALACSCDEIVLPPSAICGSIGVISMMVDQTAADAKMGLKIAVLTSGARKADGHPHAPMTDAATNAEQRRVDQLAKQFFKLVADVRPLSTTEIEALQAGIFVGKAAVKAGLADAIMGWDKLVQALDERATSKPTGRKPLDTRGTSGSPSPNSGTTSAITRSDMSLLALQASVTDLRARLAKAKDPARKATIQTALTAAEVAVAEYKKVKHTKETHEEETADEEDDEESGNETDRDEGGGGGDDDDAPDDEDDDEDDDEEEAKKASSEEEEEAKKAAASIVTAAALSGPAAKAARMSIRKAVRDAVARTLARTSKSSALVSAVRQLTGKKSTRAQIATLEARTAGTKEMSARLAAIEKDTRKRNRAAMIDEALAKRCITRGTAKTLRTKSSTYVREYLEMHKTPLVNIDDDAARVPDGSPDADVPAAAKKMVEQAIVAQGLEGEKAEKFRQQAFADHRERLSKSNGAGVY